MIDLSLFSYFCPAMNFFMEEPIYIKFVIKMENVSYLYKNIDPHSSWEE